MKLVFAAMAAALSVAQVTAARADYTVREVGSFHTGGHQVVLQGLPPTEIIFSAGQPATKIETNGEFETGQMYVQYVKLANPRSPLPLLMWHGGGLTGVTWETKPDGKPGWQQFFLQAGYDTYVSDAVERGRASWSRYPEVYTSPPIFRTKKEGWNLFRIGPSDGWSADPASRKSFEGTQFPIEAYDQFTKQAVPRWGTNDAATQAAYDELVRKICPCVIVVHSQGGNFGYTAALHNPDLVKALVLLEPSGTPNLDGLDLSKVTRVPQLVVWGDNLDRVPFWAAPLKANAAWRDAVNGAGGHVEWLELPKAGLIGNTHMMMMDKNSDVIAQRIAEWLGKQNLTP